MCIAELTYTEMSENWLWTDASTIQEWGFLVKTTCWNCGSKGHSALDCPSNKSGGNATLEENAASYQGDKPRGKWSAPRNGKPDTQEVFGKPYKYNSTTKWWDKLNQHMWPKRLNLWTPNPSLHSIICFFHARWSNTNGFVTTRLQLSLTL